MKHLLQYLLLALVAVALTGCSASRKSTSGTKPSAEAKACFETAVKSGFDFDCLQSKVKYQLAGKGLGGKLNVEHGKRLALSVTVMGIEMARVEANSDSVVIVNKLDKSYAVLSVAELAEQLGMQREMRYEALEALLLGRIFIPGEGMASASDYKRLAWTVGEENVQLGTYEGENYSLAYQLSPEGQLEQTLVTVPARNMTFGWQYAELQKLDNGGKMPAVEVLTGNLKGSAVEMQLTVEKPTLNSKGWTPFQPTEKYRRLELREFVDNLKKLKN